MTNDISGKLKPIHITSRETGLIAIIIILACLTGGMMYNYSLLFDEYVKLMEHYGVAVENLLEYSDAPGWQEQKEIVRQFFEDLKTTK